jgi:nucleoside-diphosphate-sugar epimerase
MESDTGVLSGSAPVNPGPIQAGGVLVLGGGYCGRRFGMALHRRGVPVLLSHRRADAAPSGGAAGSPAAADPPTLRFDPEAAVVPGAEDLAGVTHVLITIPPDSSGRDPVLTHLAPLLRELPLAWVGYLSTTGVYGDSGGAWVDESTPEAPRLERSRARLACERAWRDSGLPLQVFRLPAIYGPGRTPFENLRSGRARLIHKPGQVFSRVHVDDIVGALLHCLALPPRERPDTLIVADACPCPSSETLSYAAHLLGCRLPEVQRYERIAAAMSPMARSFWSENRRADSRRLRESLGYRLRHPSYREGYRACLG